MKFAWTALILWAVITTAILLWPMPFKTEAQSGAIVYLQPSAGTTSANCGTPAAGTSPPLCGTAAGWYIWDGKSTWIQIGTPAIATTPTVTINGQTGTKFTIAASNTAPVASVSVTAQ